MTCIVGLCAEGRVWMGGDSAGIAGWDLSLRADPKVFRNDEFLIGCTDSFRMGQILRYSFSPPARDPDLEIHRYLATVFVDSVRSSLKNGGFAKKENETESGGHFIIGYTNRLFLVASDYQVAEFLDGFCAIGCGMAYALGSLYSTHDRDPKTRITIALEAAEHLNAGVRGPFTIISN